MKYSGIIKLTCLLLLAPIVIWKFGLSGTYHLYTEKQKVELQSRQTPVSAPIHPSTVSPTSTEPLLSNGKLLQLFADTLETQLVQVINYVPEMIDSEGSSKLYCGKLTLAGSFIELVKVVSQIEKAGLPLKIASMSFEYDRKKRNAQKQISLRLLMEQIEYQ